ncbi:hypothetical protein P691DRAFT_678453 [Macrolepiota fuliginosa MF-IS2]|uniref:DNA replication regulator Sld3 C-terminal domain-containing protein n=1 Tax=Macrolepiota fuliginosa MF-IS2 TaxID=1400762 RepID=A0A9P5X613_9AGAR|nr:hypothetical protein P691DRAFT_678453 [Macrolepiota fuliginosa MF-IS2]
MSFVEAPYYSLEPTQGSHWTAAQEKSIAIDFPLDLQQESPGQFVTRTYLQFLWLPQQSVMPLQLLVPSVRRVATLPSSGQSPHPLHSLLDSLLQTTRAIANKYHVELVQILQDGGGAGEMEETMMWYALHNEKTESKSEPWMEEKWRQEWLERLERREIQIQILLYMTKLSLPGPAPAAVQPGKRKRSRKEADPSPPTPEERLESFMDKLSVLQLTGHLETSGPQLNHNERDWAQIFCEDIVEQIFKPQLPELCSLLRSKVFPDSLFSDTDTATASRSPSPEVKDIQIESRGPSPTPPAPLGLSKSDSRSLARARSRSLSVSLAQEREERERSVGVGPSKKRLLNREVSMSRAFKPRPKAASRAADSESQHSAGSKLKPEKTEIILVEDTPQKPRIANRKGSQSQFDVNPSSSSLFGVRQSNQSLFSSTINETDDDDAWMLDSSPDVLLLHPGRKAGDGSDEYEAVTFQTPSKKPRRRE